MSALSHGRAFVTGASKGGERDHRGSHSPVYTGSAVTSRISVWHQSIFDYDWFARQTGTPKKQPKDGELHGLEDISIIKPDIQQQQQTVDYKDIQHLAFGFRHIVEIDHLAGLVNLKKLQLDNNCLTKIENLDHLVCKLCFLLSPRKTGCHIMS